MNYVHIYSIDCKWIAVPAYVMNGNHNFASFLDGYWISSHEAWKLLALPHSFMVCK